MEWSRYLESLVAPLRSDVVSGAAEVAAAAASAVERAARKAPARSSREFRSAMETLAIRVLDAQPAMAPLVALAIRVLGELQAADTAEDEAEGAEDLAALRTAAAAAAAAFRTELAEHAEALAWEVARRIAPGTRVLTLSLSSSVREALLSLPEGHDVHVACLEGRPGLEGRRLARALAEGGISVTIAVDGAVSALARQSDLILIGADSVGDEGVVNKVGSHAAALVAREAGIPFLVAADRTKILPPGFPQGSGEDRPPEEVWRAPPGVRVWNRYFETVPLALVSALITEKGPVDRAALEAYRRSIRVPESLRAWCTTSRRDRLN
ncbi:MAG: hypothetical protein ACE5GJ_09555 [Gemmatimonadota bacterium]